MTLRITPQEYRQLLEQESAKLSHSKYRNKRIKINGKTFDSVNEGTFYLMLLRSKMEGDIVRFFRQVPIDISEETNRVYRVDFLVFESESKIHYIDVKGFVTKGFALKKSLVEARHGIIIKVINKIPPVIPRCMWEKEITCTTKRGLDKLRVPPAIF